MKNKRWFIGATAVMLVLLLLTLYVAIAADSGSKSDPLVSLSYLETIYPEFTQKIDTAIAEKTKELEKKFDDKYEEVLRTIDAQLAGLIMEGGDIDLNDPAFIDAVASAVLAKMDTTPVSGEGWKRLDLTSGQKLTGEIGCELLLRLGGGTAVASSNPAMVSLTDSSSLNNSDALKTNHHYFVTIAGNGFTAGSNGATLFVRGKYTIS